MLRAMLCMCLSLASTAVFAANPAPKANDDAQATTPGATKQAAVPGGDVVMSGLSIVGNDEAPKELVIVPWKSSQLADAPGISRLLDDSTQPVDKDVFMRELSYYGLQSAESDGN